MSIDRPSIGDENIISRNGCQKDDWLGTCERDASIDSQNGIQKARCHVDPSQFHTISSQESVQPEQSQKGTHPFHKIANRTVRCENTNVRVAIEEFLGSRLGFVGLVLSHGSDLAHCLYNDGKQEGADIG